VLHRVIAAGSAQMFDTLMKVGAAFRREFLEERTRTDGQLLIHTVSKTTNSELINRVVAEYVALDKAYYLDVKDSADRSPLLCAVQSGSIAGVRALLAAGANAMRDRPFSNCVISIAACAGHADLVRALISEFGYDITQTDPSSGQTLLHSCFRNEFNEVVPGFCLCPNCNRFVSLSDVVLCCAASVGCFH
jgi:hypothetical protein